MTTHDHAIFRLPCWCERNATPVEYRFISMIRYICGREAVAPPV